MSGQVANIDTSYPPTRPKTTWRWRTVVFAAVPATLLAFPAGVAILFGGAFSLGLNPTAIVLFLCGVLGWAGMIALWSAARSPGVVSRRTAWGLGAGIVSVLLYYGFEIFADEQGNRLWASTPLLTIGPLLFAISYLKRYRKQRRQVVVKQGGGNSAQIRTPHSAAPKRRPPPPLPGAQPAAAQPPALPNARPTAVQPAPALPRPFNEVRMRRVLALMLIIPAILELIFVPPQLKVKAGLGMLGVITGVFPFYLAIAVTAAWSFWRSRSLRWLAGATLLTPVLLPYVLSWAVKALGQEATEKYAVYTAVAIPVLMLLLKPKEIAGTVPRFVVEGRGWNVAWTGLLAVMLIPWVVLVIQFRGLEEAATQSSFSFLMVYTGISIVIAIATLISVYIGLRAQQHPQTRLRIAQIVLSLLLLLASVPGAVVIMLIFGLAGLG